jgi:hypothetical protein
MVITARSPSSAPADGASLSFKDTPKAPNIHSPAASIEPQNLMDTVSEEMQTVEPLELPVQHPQEHIGDRCNTKGPPSQEHTLQYSQVEHCPEHRNANSSIQNSNEDLELQLAIVRANMSVDYQHRYENERREPEKLKERHVILEKAFSGDDTEHDRTEEALLRIGYQVRQKYMEMHGVIGVIGADRDQHIINVGHSAINDKNFTAERAVFMLGYWAEENNGQTFKNIYGLMPTATPNSIDTWSTFCDAEKSYKNILDNELLFKKDRARQLHAHLDTAYCFYGPGSSTWEQVATLYLPEFLEILKKAKGSRKATLGGNATSLR